MTLTPIRTSRGWELVDQSGTLEAEEHSPAFPTKRAAQDYARVQHSDSFDELSAMERRFDE